MTTSAHNNTHGESQGVHDGADTAPFLDTEQLQKYELARKGGSQAVEAAIEQESGSESDSAA